MVRLLAAAAVVHLSAAAATTEASNRRNEGSACIHAYVKIDLSLIALIRKIRWNQERIKV